MLCGSNNYVLKVSRCRDGALARYWVIGRIPASRARLVAAVGGLVLLWNCLTAPIAGAETPSRCEICQGPFVESIYVVEDPIRQVKKHICLACTKSKVICSACGLAANPKTLRKLEDGRILC